MDKNDMWGRRKKKASKDPLRSNGCGRETNMGDNRCRLTKAACGVEKSNREVGTI